MVTGPQMKAWQKMGGTQGNGEAAWVYVPAFCFGDMCAHPLGVNHVMGGCVGHSRINTHSYKVDAYTPILLVLPGDGILVHQSMLCVEEVFNQPNTRTICA